MLNFQVDFKSLPFCVCWSLCLSFFAEAISYLLLDGALFLNCFLLELMQVLLSQLIVGILIIEKSWLCLLSNLSYCHRWSFLHRSNCCTWSTNECWLFLCWSFCGLFGWNSVTNKLVIKSFDCDVIKVSWGISEVISAARWVQAHELWLAHALV